MLPALPTGMASTSGARPRSSQISNAAVFWPSRRNGLTELTSVTGWSSCSASARTIPSAWSKLPSMATTRAPGDQRLEQLADRDLALGQDDDDLDARRPRRTPPPRPTCCRSRRRRSRGAPASTALATATTMPAVLERAGRVLALDLEVAGSASPSAAPSRRRVDERRERPRRGSAAGVASVTGRKRAVALDSRGRAVRDGDGAAVRGSVIDRVPDAARASRGPRASGRATGVVGRAGRGGRGPQVEPAPRAIAIRSPRTADEVAAPPAPGPSKPTRPTGSASTSIRFRTPAVRPSAESSGSAVGRTAAARPPSRPAARGREEADHPTRRRASSAWSPR